MNEGSLVSARLLLFRVGTLACAAEVEQVREILPRLPTTRIPGAPPVVAGLVNVRGTLVTVVEGWRALGQDAPPAGPAASLPNQTSEPAPDAVGGSTIILEIALVAGDKGRVIGFTVDEVMDMVSGGDASLEDRAELPGVDDALVRAVGRCNGELFIVLNVAALLGPILTT
ncbi:MAG: chemotaxis protein CheW [Gemmatimonadales bacterium]